MLSGIDNDQRRKAPADDLFAATSFGLAELKRAAAHPFRFKPSLLSGGLMFVLFIVGLSLLFFGSPFSIVIAIACGILANLLVFGILVNTADNFRCGRIDADFMPEYSALSLQNNVVRPFLLGVGANISSFLPFVVLAAIGAYSLAGSANEQAKRYNDELARLPGTEYYAPNRTAEQSQQVKELIDGVKLQNASRDSVSAAKEDHAQEAARNDQFNLTQTNSLTPSPAVAKAEGFGQTVSGILSLEAPLVVLATLAFLWGLFYFPAACASGVYSRSFRAALDPRVGLETIKRLGPTYVRLLLMWLLIVTAALIGVIAGRAILFPFYLPPAGNILAVALGGVIVFYSSIVFASLLGLVLLKSADKLRQYR